MHHFMKEDEFQQVMKNHNEYLLRLAYLYVKDWQATEDIVQDVLLKFYKEFGQFEERSSLRTYLASMTINKCKDYLRSWRYRKQVLTNSFSNQTKNRNRMVEHDEKLELADAILHLPLKYREVIIYYYYENFSVLEVAQLLSISNNTVKTRLRKARALLREQLKDNQWEVLLNE